VNQAKEHYSYRVYADPEVARNFDQDRFGGPIGELIHSAQERALFSVLPPVAGWKVIDVGAGTGRLTIPFLDAGAEVTACDASTPMLEVLRQKTQNPNLRTVVADAHQLEFSDRAFDCALGFRVLLHVMDWKKALSELCRVSRDWVVFDLPPHHGFLRLAPFYHKLRSRSQDHQSYRTFPLDEVQAELSRNGCKIFHIDPGFFFPLALHRFVRSRSFTRSVENAFSRAGLTRKFGSPFTFFARRTE
jgi:ubiquinone/menaquinone biosynthesis C-methylase UbiE